MPNTSTTIYLRGEQLLRALKATSTPVRWFPLGVIIQPDMAVAIAAAGAYEGKVTPRGRVKHIREYELPMPPLVPNPLRQDSWWDGRGCIRFAKGVDRATVDLWNWILNRKPLPNNIIVSARP